ncbi:iron-containing redox enzyme family protein [Nocardioides sambongensis]|uniref:iron-containing redox enzyme family protein n=1 Tax=Nocardioides sambongensis TaxID=2589074 RepID=UPI0011288E06|nr:iron-containing redox enzyme family protein [Nocardioides sambongensis]
MNPSIAPCGPISTHVLGTLCGDAPPAGWAGIVESVADPLVDRDFQLGLWLAYEPHFGDLPGLDRDPEWDPALLTVRAALEERFERALRDLTSDVTGNLTGDLREQGAVARLREMTAVGRPSPLALRLGREATREEFVDYLTQRAVYHLRESDPQSFALPRVGGAAKTALAELQYDEYGAGRPERLHSHLYARALQELGLPTDVLAYLPEVEATVLTTVNTMAFFALHRRLRGAAMGHLAAFEATSSLPCRLVAAGAHRLDLPPEVAAYFEEHVEADAVHEQVAIDDICGALVAADPLLAADVVFGAAACLAVDELVADAFHARWDDAAGAAEAS